MNKFYILLTTATLALSLEAMERSPQILTQSESPAIDWIRTVFQMGNIESTLKSFIAESNTFENATNKIRCYALQDQNIEYFINHDYELNKELLITLARKFTHGDIFIASRRYQTPAIEQYIEKKVVKKEAYANYVQKDTQDFTLAVFARDEKLATQLAQRIRKSAFKDDFDKTVQALYDSFTLAHQTKNRATKTLHTYHNITQSLLKLGARSEFATTTDINEKKIV